MAAVRIFHTATAVLVLGILISIIIVPLVSAEKDSNPYPWGSNPNNALKMYWNDARNILQDLDQFNALYIKYHACVWSECSVDNYDDDGENRDGDEYWYQYRTQPFCANAGYSLYGVLKNRVVLPWDHCSRGTYINSFFTYGGADTLLEAFDDLSASTIFDSYNNNNNNNNNNNGDGTHPNAVCYVQNGGQQQQNQKQQNQNDDYANGYSSTMGCSADGKRFVGALFRGQVCEGNLFQETIDEMTTYNTIIQRNFRCRQIYSRRKDGGTVRNYYQAVQEKQQQQNYNNNNNNKNNNGHRLLPEVVPSTTTTTTTTTNWTNGSMVILGREDFTTKPTTTATTTTTTTTTLRGSRVPQTAMERTLGNNNNNNNNNNDDDSISVPDIAAWTILSQSWACDVSLYPDGCPDPYRMKRRYDAVLTAAARGRNGKLARFHYTIAHYLRAASVVALISGILLYISSYYMSRRESFQTNGFCTTICTDMKQCCIFLGKLLRKCCRALVNVITGKTRRQRRAAAAAAAATASASGRSSTRSSSSTSRSKVKKSRSSSVTTTTTKSKKKKKKTDQRRSKSMTRSRSPKSPRSTSTRSRSSRDKEDADSSRDYFAFF